jgi:PAS domain S-box-containing protein
LNTLGFFETFFNNARYNGIIIMDTKGFIIEINEAFHLRFGYTIADLSGKDFSILFTEKDREISKPVKELQHVLTTGSANDENYLVHRNGNKVWVTGESVLIENDKDEAYIVKVVHNIHAQKQLERFLLQAHEFIDTVFDSIDASALLLLDSHLRVVRTNKAFVEMFELDQAVTQGSRLADIDHLFWQRPDVKQEAVRFLTMQNMNETKLFDMENKSGLLKQLSLQAKLIESVPGSERRLLIMLQAL